ncbi:MAG: ABC transporter permease subunit [Fimbriimonadaceae bacterium]
MSSSPIADLSYRNYDGPLEPLNHRWWSIAKSTMRIAFKKKWLWICAVSSCWYFIAMTFYLFIMNKAIEAQAGTQMGEAVASFFGRINWKEQFVHGFAFGQIWYFLVALMIGAGCIANDTRANALLVYLSKPISKRDYVIGKWFGIFLPLLVAMAAPSFLFYIYGLMSFRGEGFVSQDPWLPLKLLVFIPFAAAFHASLVIGISSMFSQGRTAGAVYASFYFLTNFFTKLMSFAYVAFSGQLDGRRGRPARAEASEGVLQMLNSFAYSSVDGVCNGFCQLVLGTDGGVPFNIQIRGNVPNIPSPSIWFVAPVGIVLSALCLFVAWRRVRAVDIVG